MCVRMCMYACVCFIVCVCVCDCVKQLSNEIRSIAIQVSYSLELDPLNRTHVLHNNNNNNNNT